MTKRSAVALAVAAAATTIVAAPLARGATGSTQCTDGSRACVISAAKTYIDAFLSHDGSKVRLAPNARRTENGMVTGTSGREIANNLSTNQGDHAIYALRDVRWFVDGDQAIAYYLQDTAAPNTNAPHTATVHLAERFKVDRGLIQQIEAIFWASPGPTPESSGWEAPSH
ncbi:MAG: cysQ [Acidimicrobiales bacterium]|nr:cysQ [Acidimicrobiales bacterium]